jgi:hypothetical protein
LKLFKKTKPPGYVRYPGLRSVRHLALALVLLAITSLSLYPVGGAAGTRPDIGPFFILSGVHAGADALLNVIFYLPLGLVLSMYSSRWRRTIALGALLSLTMESAQIMLPGRFPSPVDIFTNTLGTALGSLPLLVGPQLLRCSPRVGQLASLVCGIAFALTCAVSGYLMTPRYVPGDHVGGWTPRLAQYVAYEGDLSSATMGSVALPRGIIPDANEIEFSFRDGAHLLLLGTTGPTPTSLSPVFALVRRYSNQFILVGVDGDHVAIRLRLQARRWRLREPSMYLPAPDTGFTAGHPFQIEIWREGSRTCANLGEGADCSIANTVGDMWRLLIDPVPTPGFARQLVTFAWLAGLTLWAGLWLTADPRSWGGALFVLVGATLTPTLSSLGPTTGLEWAGIAFGLVLGVSASRIIRQPRRTENVT